MLLKKGSKGEDVKRLQAKLGLTADGDFGPGTEAKVKAWQVEQGLIADGMIDQKSWTALFTNESNAEPAPECVVIPSSGFKLTSLQGHIPDAVIAQIPDTATKFNITNPLRLAHLLAQCAHESAGFKKMEENLSYSSDWLKKIFPKYFNAATTDAYARQPDKIASKIYANRLGNGDEASGDGYKFRGRGYIQLTGKSNYAYFAKSIGEDIVAHPDLVATKYPLASAAFFFDSKGLWKVCDEGATDEVVMRITKQVNGGMIGMSERIKLFKEYYALLKKPEY